MKQPLAQILRKIKPGTSRTFSIALIDDYVFYTERTNRDALHMSFIFGNCDMVIDDDAAFIENIDINYNETMIANVCKKHNVKATYNPEKRAFTFSK